LEDNLRKNYEEKEPTERATFMLRQAIISEVFDITHMLKAIEEQISAFDVSSGNKTDNVNIVIQMSHIIRYVKKVYKSLQVLANISQHLEIGPNDELLPYEMTKQLSNGKIAPDNKTLAKVISLKNLTKGCIYQINKDLAALSENLPNERSPKLILLYATKVRNIRNGTC
jgi:hypothetical protein